MGQARTCECVFYHPFTLCVQEVFNLKKESLLVTGRNLEQSDSLALHFKGSEWNLTMTPKLSLIIMFLMSRIGILNASSQCHTGEHSIGGMFLRGHTFKTYRVGLPEMCYFRCEEEVTCQSYNFVIAQKICELNNRTKEATPEDFMPDQRRFYMKRSQNRGTPFTVLQWF